MGVGFPTERVLRSWWIYLSLTLASALVARIVLAGGTLRFESATGDGLQLGLSALCALLAMLVGALVLRRIESSILRLAVAAFATRRPPQSVRRTAGVRLRAAVAVESTYCLFRPNRPPPLLFA